MKKILTILTIIVALIATSFLSYRIGENKGEYKGSVIGFNMAIDTVNKIIVNQVKSDTTVSKVFLINKDTNIFFLQHNKIIK